MVTVLRLKDQESKAVDDYKDDSVDPLRGIIARWKAALDAKGRVPLSAPK